MTERRIVEESEDLLCVAVAFPVKEADSAVGITKTELVESVIECAVCLQSCIHPVKLPCSHIFCYLCVKGVAFQSRRCAMCRQDIPADFLLHPQLIDRAQLEKETPLDDGYQWFYEGRNGWWQYDDRTATTLEEMYTLGERKAEMLIAGATYVIDFQTFVQFPKQRTGQTRKIKRALPTSVTKLGVAGIRY